MINDMSNKVWDEITYPVPNFNDNIVKLLESINNFILGFMIDVITYRC